MTAYMCHGGLTCSVDTRFRQRGGMTACSCHSGSACGCHSGLTCIGSTLFRQGSCDYMQAPVWWVRGFDSRYDVTTCMCHGVKHDNYGRAQSQTNPTKGWRVTFRATVFNGSDGASRASGCCSLPYKLLTFWFVRRYAPPWDRLLRCPKTSSL